MVKILHGRAGTTPATRGEIQHSQESLKVLSDRYGINIKTARKWSKRDFVDDAPMGPKDRGSKVLSPVEEAVCVYYRLHTLLPLDDCLYDLREQIPHPSVPRCTTASGDTESAALRLRSRKGL